MYAPPTIPTLGARMQPWESKVLLRPSGLDSDWTLWRPLWKLKDSGGQVRRSTPPAATQDKPTLKYKFSCLLSLPPTNLESSGPFFSLLPSVYRGEFQISLGKLPWLWTKCFIFNNSYYHMKWKASLHLFIPINKEELGSWWQIFASVFQAQPVLRLEEARITNELVYFKIALTVITKKCHLAPWGQPLSHH